ncbi:hypothetical protein ACVGVM_22185 [Pseudonocardia bannensis]|uniref:ARB-07466-like C-terminal domain-containing protein n=1 Tax=Pseudonocardia bannensis TaxID=630973 RepID=A0A848DGS9_9PSEU|nr:hypothetical protein [Pseudonocardia bannensis]NMH91878.1 hypothetical protein [Pseudonocardia bannensis]
MARPGVPTPVRRGVAVVAVAGGALSLVGAAAPGPGAVTGTPQADPGPGAQPAALLLTTGTASSDATAAAPALVEQRTLAPVAPETEILDASALVKAVQLAEDQAAEAERKAAEAKAEAERKAAEAKKAAEVRAVSATTTAATGALGCGLSTASLGDVKPWVEQAAEFLGCLFGKPTMIGQASRGNASDHPSGLALDFMMRGATGDRLAECAVRNKDALGITYVIWKQRINFGSGWQPMEDRGSDTANHFDHVHVSFEKSAPGGRPTGC